MATSTSKKLSDLFTFNQILNPAGSFNTSATTPAVAVKPPVVAPTPALNKNVPSSLTQLSIPTPQPTPISPTGSLAGIGTKVALTPNGSVVPPASVPATPTSSLSSVYAGGPITPPAPVVPPATPAPTGATGATGSSGLPASYFNVDGTLKTPDQVANDVGNSLSAAHGNPDIGTLAVDQFGNGGTTADAEAAARRINNTRNDIAVGATDPYGVGDTSGIAYTPDELSAIEKAYAGIYTPALDTALAKVTDKQAADKAAADQASSLEQIKAQQNAPYTLGKDEVRYDGDGNPIAVGPSSATASAIYVPGQDPVADSWVKYVQGGGAITAVPDAYKDAVAQGLATASSNAPLSPTSTTALGIIAQIENDPGINAISGTRGILPTIPGSEPAALTNLTKQLAATIALGNRQQLKGQGAISDFEFKVLGDAATALGIDSNGHTNLSADQFKKALSNLELKLQVGPLKTLTDDEVQNFSSQGYTPDQIRAYDTSQTFNSVGNTTASSLPTAPTSNDVSLNRPQRNNNPGDVKAGGLADALAVGKDDEGHLIFKTPTDGFKALTADVTAKINGASKYLPNNPTIAQLGKVYAEDPNWGARVAAIIGVPASTPTQSVALTSLVKAIATQEGYYA